MANVLNYLRKPFEPLLVSLHGYTFGKLRSDLVAGLTVSALEIPQAMAYAWIAGVPPEYGLYTSIIQGLIGALFSSNDRLATGPTNTQSLLVASIVTRVMAQQPVPIDPGPVYLQLVIALTMLKGLIQLACAAGRMGTLLRYVSQSVMVGFTAGAGVLIAIGQLPAFLGLSLPVEMKSLPGVIGEVLHIAPHIHEVNTNAILIGSLTLVIVLASRYVWHFMPGPLLAIIVVSGIVGLAGWTQEQLPLISAIPSHLPEFALPRLSLGQAELLLTGAAALALQGMIETAAIGKTLAARGGFRFQPNREFFGQGLANFVGSFFQCIPGSGSFTRSVLLHTAGAQSRFAGVFNVAFVALTLLLFAPLTRYIPLSSLAGILFVVAYQLIDWRYVIRVMRSHRSDAIVCLITFVATITLPLEYAIFVGVFLNIALYLRRVSHLHIAEMVQNESAGSFTERPLHERHGHGKAVFLQVEGDLFFGVADELHDRLNELAITGTRAVILRLKRTHSIDATVLQVLEHFARDLQARDGYLILCGVRPELMDTMRRFGLFDAIGEKNVFEASDGIFTSAKKALRRAEELLHESVTYGDNRPGEQTRSWAYDI